MTDSERSEIDQEMTLSLKQCCKQIDTLKADLGRLSNHPQYKNNYCGVQDHNVTCLLTESSRRYHSMGENEREHLNGIIMDLYKRLEEVGKLHAHHR